MKITIKSFDGLINLIEDHDLSMDQIKTLLSNLPAPIFLGTEDMNRVEVLDQLRTYWKKYGNNPEKPLFLK